MLPVDVETVVKGTAWIGMVVEVVSGIVEEDVEDAAKVDVVVEKEEDVGSTCLNLN